LDNLKDLSDLAGWLAFFKVNYKAKACAAGHCQILLGNHQLFTPCSNSGAKLFWSSSIHITDREYTLLEKVFQRGILPFGNICQYASRLSKNITER
jgi:hypothetical protein